MPANLEFYHDWSWLTLGGSLVCRELEEKKQTITGVHQYMLYHIYIYIFFLINDTGDLIAHSRPCPRKLIQGPPEFWHSFFKAGGIFVEQRDHLCFVSVMVPSSMNDCHSHATTIRTTATPCHGLCGPPASCATNITAQEGEGDA